MGDGSIDEIKEFVADFVNVYTAALKNKMKIVALGN